MTRTNTPRLLRSLACALMLLACVGLWTAPALAQATAGGTQIQNRASATYSDGTTSYQTVSNTVTVTVANVSGLAITPDGGSVPTVVSGQNSVDFTFTVTNTGNYATQVRFLASGASVQLSGPATIQSAVIDVNGNGIDGADTDIKGNASDVLSAALARNASVNVIVRVNIDAAAAAGATINVRLGDASSGGPTFDNQTANNSANEVRTSTPSGTTDPVNGQSEARGDISTTVQNDAQLRLSLNAPAGPVALGSNITYTWSLDNTGQRAVTAQTLTGGTTGVFVIAPVPVNTTFVSVTPPAGVTVLYSTSPLTNDPLSALTTWSATPPPAGSVTRVAFNVGATLAAGANVANMQMVVSVNTGINASNPIWEIGDSLGKNSIGTPITDQSGDSVANKGDGNANFNEPRFGIDPVSATQGFQLPTTLTLAGAVLIGPQGQPNATGPSGSTNDDYTNKSIPSALFATVPPGGTVAGFSLDFVNTVKNTGNGNDTFTLTAPIIPSGYTVQISTNGGTSFSPVTSVTGVTLALTFGQQADIVVRVTAPAGSNVLTGFATTIRATSTNTNTQTNDTIDRIYTGFLRLDKSVQVFNSTGVGGPTDAVPGADIEYTITYTNVSSSGDASNPNGGTGCVKLTITNIVIDEDGNALPNNWGSTTTQVLAPTPPSDTKGGTITDGAGGALTTATTRLKDTVTTAINAGEFGKFVFRRKIN